MKKHVPFFSVVILAWQVEKYIKDCLESVKQQTFTDFEAIIILPHGEDNTAEICRRFVRQDARFSIIETENQGQLINREIGFCISSGTYLLCLDGDDLWKHELLQVLYNGLKENPCDMVIFGYECFQNEQIIKAVTDTFPDWVIFRGEGKKVVYDKYIRGGPVNPIWCKAISKAAHERVTIESDKYRNLRRAEDLLYSCYITDSAEDILYLSEPLYRYRKHADSITYRFQEKEIKECYRVKEEILSFMHHWEMDGPDYQTPFFYSVARYTADWVFRCEMSDLSFKKKRELFQWLKYESPFYQKISPLMEETLPKLRHRLFVKLFFINELYLELYGRIYKLCKALFKENFTREF